MRHRPGRFRRGPNRRARARNHVAGEASIGILSVDPLLCELTVGREITDRGVMLVECMDRNPLRIGAGGLRQRLTKLDLAVIGDPDPVDRTQHNRLPFSHQDDAAATERMNDSFRRVIGERAANRRRGVHCENADLQGLGGPSGSHCRGKKQGEHFEMSKHRKVSSGSGVRVRYRLNHQSFILQLHSAI